MSELSSVFTNLGLKENADINKSMGDPNADASAIPQKQDVPMSSHKSPKKLEPKE